MNKKFNYYLRECRKCKTIFKSENKGNKVCFECKEKNRINNKSENRHYNKSITTLIKELTTKE